MTVSEEDLIVAARRLADRLDGLLERLARTGRLPQLAPAGSPQQEEGFGRLRCDVCGRPLNGHRLGEHNG